jgi:predicted lactoylglutathione lyase
MNPILNSIDIVVADLNAAMAFYARLGVEFTPDQRTPGHADCLLPNGLHLMLDAEELRSKMTSGWSRTTGGPRTFLAFQFPGPAEVDAKYAELTAVGYRGLTDPWDAFWGMRYATVLDPDGNGVDLYADLPTR